MEDMLASIVSKIDKIQCDTTDIKVQLAVHGELLNKNTVDLEKHIKRTDLLEEKLELHEKDDNDFHDKVEKKFIIVNQPLSAKELFKNVSIALGIVAALASAIYNGYKIYRGF